MRRRHPDDVLPTPPRALDYLWTWFREISAGRPYSSGGQPLPVPSVEIDAWSRLARVQLEPWQVSALREIDCAFLRVMAE